MEKIKQLYEGKAKKMFSTENEDIYIQEFKDDATAFDATKRGTIHGKGLVNNKISTKLFELLESKGIPTHFIELINDREMLVKKSRNRTPRGHNAKYCCRWYGKTS